MRFTYCTIVCLPAIVVCGCTGLDPRPDYDRAARHVEAAVGEAGIYRPEDEAIVAGRVADLLRDGLTAREAVQVCLLNNPRLATELLKVGVARAEFVQSGLLSNPTLSFAPRWPDGGGLSNLQLGLAMNVAELWQVPYRHRAAAAELDRVILDVAREAAMLALRTRLAYYDVLRSERDVDIAKENAGLTRNLVDLTTARRDAGAANETDVALAQAQHADARLRTQNAAMGVTRSRAELARLLGLGGSLEGLQLLDTFPEPDEMALSAEHIVATAGRMRLDLRASRMAAETAQARLDYERSRFIRVFEVGVTAERNAQFDKSRGGGLGVGRSVDIADDLSVSRTTSISREAREPVRSEWVVGPGFGLDVPVFDQNQAQIARADHMLAQSRRLIEAIERETAQDAHAATAQLAAAGANVRLFREEILPLRDRVLSLSQDGYRSGRTTFLAVLEAQRSLLEARAGYVAAQRDLAAAVVEIERIAGCAFRQLVPAIGSADPGNPPASQPRTAAIQEQMERNQ